MKTSLIEVGRIHTDGKGGLRKVLWVCNARWEIEYLQLTGRYAGAKRKTFLASFADWARAEVEATTNDRMGSR